LAAKDASKKDIVANFIISSITNKMLIAACTCVLEQDILLQ
jgi:hypothetical protein